MSVETWQPNICLLNDPQIQCLSFDADTLNPCLASLVGGLMQLISEVDSLESKTQITKTLNAVIEANAVRVCAQISQPCKSLIIALDNSVHGYHHCTCAQAL